MTTHTIQIIYVFVMLAMIGIGVYCASHLNADYPLWVRLIVLFPCMVGLTVLLLMLKNEHVAYLGDIALALSFCLLYALVASRFSSRPWLDMRVSKGGQS